MYRKTLAHFLCTKRTEKASSFHCDPEVSLTCLLMLTIMNKSIFFSQSAFVGLALAYVIQTAALTQYAVRKSSDVENFMTSVERVMTYTKLDPEPGYKVGQRPPEHWPGEGNIMTLKLFNTKNLVTGISLRGTQPFLSFHLA